ncbi:hypothetical protein FRC02_000376 [Tulasnella sp. 418]|nr:hypothetical protein FRC02_000376 [Tulasnella sp. 418]
MVLVIRPGTPFYPSPRHRHSLIQPQPMVPQTSIHPPATFLPSAAYPFPNPYRFSVPTPVPQAIYTPSASSQSTHTANFNVLNQPPLQRALSVQQCIPLNDLSSQLETARSPVTVDWMETSMKISMDSARRLL